MNTATVKTGFLILSDTHDLDLTKSYAKIPPVDVVIHCGDITEGGGIEHHRQAIKGLASIRSELKLVIAGNHDIDLNPTHSQASETAEALWSSAFDDGIHYLKESTYNFTLKSGATFSVHASPYTPQYGVGSGFQYPTNEDRYNRSSPDHATNRCTESSFVPENIDILLTHGPPKYILDNCADRFQSSGGCEHLRRAVCRVRPRLHCFGHIHSAWGAIRAHWSPMTDGKWGGEDDDHDIYLLPPEFVGRNSSRRRGYASLCPAAYEQCKAGEQTLFINAALGNDDGVTANMPWIVDLSLEVGERYGMRN